MNSLIAAARRRGARIGRPRIEVDREKLVELYKAKKSVRAIAREMRIGPTTVHRLLKNLHSSLEEAHTRT